jgi:hypothetical protein
MALASLQSPPQPHDIIDVCCYSMQQVRHRSEGCHCSSCHELVPTHAAAQTALSSALNRHVHASRCDVVTLHYSICSTARARSLGCMHVAQQQCESPDNEPLTASKSCRSYVLHLQAYHVVRNASSFAELWSAQLADYSTAVIVQHSISVRGRDQP